MLREFCSWDKSPENSKVSMMEELILQRALFTGYRGHKIRHNIKI